MFGRLRGAVLTLAIVGIAAASSPGRAYGQRYPQQLMARADVVAQPLVQQAKSPKSPGTSALISLLITGGGQIYNEDITKGVIMLLVAVGFTAIAIDGIDEYDCDPFENCAPWMLPVGLSGALVMKVWSVIDAASGARKWNERNGLAGLPVRPSLGLRPLRGGRVGINLLGAAF